MSDTSVSGVDLGFLEFIEVGPAKRLRYEPNSRANIITGDNSFGKTFLLESVWWTLAGTWIDAANAPRRDASRDAPRMLFSLNTSRKTSSFDMRYDWNRHAWIPRTETERPAGVAIYARHDGSYVIWDTISGRAGTPEPNGQVVLDRKELGHGKRGSDHHDH